MLLQVKELVFNKFAGLLLILTVSVLLSAVFHQDHILQTLASSGEKVAVPLQSNRAKLGDHHYYYILSKKAPNRWVPFVDEATKSQQPFFYENSGLENIYGGALLTAGLIDIVAKWIPVSWSLQVTLSVMLQTVFLFLALLTSYSVLRGCSKVPWLELLLFGFLWALFSRSAIYGIYFGSPSYLITSQTISYYPDFLRLVNPQITWAFALFYISLLVSYQLSPSRYKYGGLFLLSFLFGLFSIALTATVLLALCLYALSIYIKERRIDLPIWGIVSTLFVSLVFSRYQFYLFSLSDAGQDLQTGQLIKFGIKWHYFYLLIFLPLFLSYVSKSIWVLMSLLYVSSLLLGSVSDSFYLSGRLWLRGAGVFVWLMILFGLTEFLRTTLFDKWKKLSNFKLFQVLSCVGICFSAYVALQVSFTGWYGYLEKDKVGVVNWLYHNTSADDVVVSPDFEDAYLIPIYTKAQPYVQIFDYSALSDKELISRYFNALDFMGKKDEYVLKILETKKEQLNDLLVQIKGNPDDLINYDEYQVYTFFVALLYYRWHTDFKDIFDSPSARELFVSKIKAISNRSSRQHIPDNSFIIFKKDTGASKPEGFSSVYENTTYEILINVLHT